MLQDRPRNPHQSRNSIVHVSTSAVCRGILTVTLLEANKIFESLKLRFYTGFRPGIGQLERPGSNYRLIIGTRPKHQADLRFYFWDPSHVWVMNEAMTLVAVGG